MEKIDLLRKEILCLQGLGTPPDNEQSAVLLGPILDNMPGKVFPTGAIHEFLSPTATAAAAASGFISAIISSLMKSDKPCLWVSTNRTLFPPALKTFGIDPDRMVFIDVTREKEALWVIEEALRCEALCAVMGEVRELNFTQSRRLQLAVESSRVTGFIHRRNPRIVHPTASVARWQIAPISSQTKGGLPGLGYPRWEIELLKIRNGKPGSWQLQWSSNAFHRIIQPVNKTLLPVLENEAI